MQDVLENILEIIKDEQCKIEYKKVQKLLKSKEGTYYREIFLILDELSKTKKPELSIFLEEFWWKYAN